MFTPGWRLGLLLGLIGLNGALRGQEQDLRQRFVTGQRVEEQGDFEQARKIFSDVVERSDRNGDEATRVMALDNLAATYADMARYDDAERIWKRTLAATERLAGPKSASMARVLWNLGSMYRETGRQEDADSFIRRFEEIAPLDLTSDPILASENLSYLGLIYIGRRMPEKAIPLFSQSLEIMEKQPNFSRAQAARILIESAAACSDAQRFGDAMSNLNKAGAFLDTLEQPPLRLKLELLATRGRINAHAKHIAEADECYSEAERIAEQTYGPDHPFVAMVLRSHAAMLRQAGDKKHAAALEKRADLIFTISRRTNSRSNSIDVSTLGLRASGK